MKLARFGILTVTLLAVPVSAYPWGAVGHRAVGRIAENHLSPQAARAVSALLGNESLARASTWADAIRSDPDWEHAPPWHYVTIEDGETYATSEKNPDGDVVEALGRFEAVLRDSRAPAEERRQALRWLVHLVGDVHQPLHVARGGDQGGNDTVVLWFGEPSNLHRVWDSDMINSTRLSYTELVEFIDHASAQEVAQWQSASYLDWVEESFDERQRVYAIGNARLGYEYRYKNLPLVEKRILQAGIRLAGLLDRIFSPE